MKFSNLFLVLFSIQISACSSIPVKSQAYAKLSNSKTFEYEFPVVWKGIESALREYKLVEKDEEDGKIETDWILGQSRDKYQEYKINQSPRKKYLQVRFRYFIKAQKKLGGVEVGIRTEEEVEKLNSDGTSAGYSSTDQVDSSRANEVLAKIENSILAALP
jgi:hypothetical protein